MNEKKAETKAAINEESLENVSGGQYGGSFEITSANKPKAINTDGKTGIVVGDWQNGGIYE